MIDEHKNDPIRSALVVLNSFDYEKEDIEEVMVENRTYADVFEIDRMRTEDRALYLNCFYKKFQTTDLPMIFVKEKFVGGLEGL